MTSIDEVVELCRKAETVEKWIGKVPYAEDLYDTLKEMIAIKFKMIAWKK